MTIDDDRLPAWVVEQRERALEPLDVWAAGRADDRLRPRMETEQEYRAREAAEGEAAMPAYWERVWAAAPGEDLHWPTGPDRRLHGRDAAIADGWVRDETVDMPPFDSGSAA